MRIAVIGHVEHITLGWVPAVPRAGEIAHLASPRVFPGGGGGVAFYQLTRSPAEILLYTAIGDDDAGAAVAAALARTPARVYAAPRAEAHTRDVVLITPDGERTIVVVGEPLHPRRDDALPWDELAGCDAAYFTAQDPAAIQAARAARILVVSARRRQALDQAGVVADVVVGSARDPREVARRADFAVPPAVLVMTEGAEGGVIETEGGVRRFPGGTSPARLVSAYGAGDSFAGALVYHLAAGASVDEACARAASRGAAVLEGPDPLAAQRPLP